VTAQDLLDRLAILQLREQEAKTRAAEYIAERERLVLEHVRRELAPESTPRGMLS
jgi:hypothetical protein